MQSRTHLVGHSAGSHLCAMALLLDEEETQKKESEKLKSFIGMCGVYNIEAYYEYEDKRGLAMLSTMGRAMGGREKFKEMSPFHILEDRSSSSSNNKSRSSDSGGEDNNERRCDEVIVSKDVFVHLGYRYCRPQARVGRFAQDFA